MCIIASVSDSVSQAMVRNPRARDQCVLSAA